VDPPYTGILSNTVAGPSCRSCIADVLEAKGLTPRLEGILETQHALHQPEPANCDHDVAFAASDHPPESPRPATGGTECTPVGHGMCLQGVQPIFEPPESWGERVISDVAVTVFGEPRRVVGRSDANLGTVKLTSTAATWGVIATPNASGRCRGVPRNERARTQKSLMASTELMSSNREQVVNGVVDREEPLGLCHRFESPHVALALAGRLV
jgi:hypothetical protein